MASYGGNTWIFDFNNTTGVVSTPINLGNFGSYGTAFSPDNSKLYTGLNGNIYQFDICAGSPTAIISSKTIIGNTSPNWTGQMQIGADAKLYISQIISYNPGYPYLAIINNPNMPGLACNYIGDGLFLSGKGSQLGIPNIVDYYPQYDLTFSTNNCVVNFTVPLACAANPVFSWNFGDPTSGVNNTSAIQNPSHTYSNNGVYDVTLIVNGYCKNDTVKKTINITSCSNSIIATATTSPICVGTCATVTSTGSGGTAPYTYSWNTGETVQNISPCPVSTTTYTVTIRDTGGNNSTSTAVVTVNPAVTATTTVGAITCIGTSTGSVTATGNSGASPYTFNWSTGATTTGASSTLPNLPANTYSVTVTDSKGCTTTTTATLDAPTPLVGQFTKGTATCNNCGCQEWILVNATGGTSPYTYLWSAFGGYDKRYQNKICPGNYSVNIRDKNGCSVNINLSVP